ncbi:MAG: hypothetical protein HOG34_03725 [Bacteroidetes bacterium]|nr:hypothetical protein [Bacteroidota bacterium]
MKNRKTLSEMIELVKNSKAHFSKKGVEELLSTDLKPSKKSISLNRPRKVLKVFNPLKITIMSVSIIGIISIIISMSFFPRHQLKETDVQISTPEIAAGIQEEKNSNISNAISRETEKISDHQIPDNTREVISSKTQDSQQAVSSPLPDTVINGKILELSKSELEKLGFAFDEFGYYYLNKLGDGSMVNFWNYLQYDENNNHGSNGFGRGGFRNQAIKKEPSALSYYPVCVSETDGAKIIPMRGLPEDFRDNFDFYNDTLIPVLLRGEWVPHGDTDDDVLAWFTVNADFFTELSENSDLMTYSQHQNIKDLTIQFPNTDFVQFDLEVFVPLVISTIQLERSSMACLGLQEFTDSIVMQYHKGARKTEIWLSTIGGGTQSIENPFDFVKPPDELLPAPILSVYDPVKRTSMSLNPQKCYDLERLQPDIDWLDISIPIQFISDSSQLGYKCIFWFLPSDELFSCLPDSIAGPMKKEFEAHVKPNIAFSVSTGNKTDVANDNSTKANEPKIDEAIPCQYFPSFCEGLPGVNNLNVYPNPVDNELSLEIILSRKKSNRI